LNEPLYQVRRYGEKLGDYQMVDAWMRDHGRGAFQENLMPALGLFVTCQEPGGASAEDLAVGWLYLDNSIGVCHLDHFVTRPGLTVAQAYVAMQVLVECMLEEARTLNYGRVNVFTPPAIARFLRRMGFAQRAEGLTMLTMNLY
jgi:hypothetical protein